MAEPSRLHVDDDCSRAGFRLGHVVEDQRLVGVFVNCHVFTDDRRNCILN
jgi:hypothetical protein